MRTSYDAPLSGRMAWAIIACSMLDSNHDMPDVKSLPGPAADAVKPLRWRAAVAWAAWVLCFGLLWSEHRLRVLHPYSVLFILLLVVLFGAAIGGLVRGLWRVLRGPRRAAALAWTLAAMLPVLLWLAPVAYGWQQWRKCQAPADPAFTVVKMTAACLMEAQARFLYPHRLETERLVMFYGDGVAN